MRVDSVLVCLLGRRMGEGSPESRGAEAVLGTWTPDASVGAAGAAGRAGAGISSRKPNSIAAGRRGIRLVSRCDSFDMRTMYMIITESDNHIFVKSIAISITEAARNFSDCVNRVA